jgi:hypothetical protein
MMKYYRKILNEEDQTTIHKYLLKYGSKDETLMMEDLSYRIDFIKKK